MPARLSAAIESLLERRPRGPLAESSRRLSENYRARRPSSDAIRDETDALAYALTRMPATYAATDAALARLAEQWPEFAPGTSLDVGCGLGAASYAACARWPDIEAAFLDRSLAFLALAEKLANESRLTALASIIEADLTRFLTIPSGDADGRRYDLVVAAYALTELDAAALSPLAAALWARTVGALVIVEPGTPRDYQRLIRIRAGLIDAGATILAPCPHARPCPLAAPEWCHFSVRLPRSRAHKMLKDAKTPYEDEKFSYLVAARAGAPAAARVIALRLCAQAGIHETFTPRRDKAGFKGIRKKDWGDSLDAPPEVA